MPESERQLVGISSRATRWSNVAERRRVAIVIPCRNEEAAIGRVIRDFRTVIPDAEIVVVDNASRDNTASVARHAGARVVHESRPGKGYALLHGFDAAGDADYYVMVDGDDTYPAEAVLELLDAAIESKADVVVGTRLDGLNPEAFPRGHVFGNRMFSAAARLLFGIRSRDLFSGFRVLSRRFLLTIPLISTGFDIEAELSVQARVNRFRVVEIPVAYRRRTGNSFSKLRTVRDGLHIAAQLLILFREYHPLSFFGWLSVSFVVAGLWSGWQPVDDFLRTGLVHHLPRAVLAAALFILAAISASLGMLLSSINRRSAEIAALIRKHGR